MTRPTTVEVAGSTTVVVPGEDVRVYPSSGFASQFGCVQKSNMVA